MPKLFTQTLLLNTHLLGAQIIHPNIVLLNTHLLAAQIIHPNIVTQHSSSRCPNNTLFCKVSYYYVFALESLVPSQRVRLRRLWPTYSFFMNLRLTWMAMLVWLCERPCNPRLKFRELIGTVEHQSCKANVPGSIPASPDLNTAKIWGARWKESRNRSGAQRQNKFSTAIQRNLMKT